MLKYCNRCKRDLEINNFYSFKKSICKQCVNKKNKCDYCDKEFNSTNLSKHIKQIHSTLVRSDKSDSTLQRSDKNNETLYPTIEDGLHLNKYIELKKDKIYDIKTRDQINKILTKNRMLHDKIKNKTITKREEEQYENNINKLRDLNYFDERACKIHLKCKHLD